ncbi:MAG: type II toxin-antitoxin system ParD family antitoxin [Rhodospirillaceae bacterium]|nr:type II toxin-antitoxin system ParD family antitoxin [Rhodospirillaceae bacterium]MYG53019.1 type II toxin-antitoxin system ParD family antitoxin [Rhodospirillaceae bacterium]
MSTMIILLSKSLKSFVESQVASGSYSTSSEYVRELIRKDRDRRSLHALVLEGAASPPAGLADADYFDRLRCRVREAGR